MKRTIAIVAAIALISSAAFAAVTPPLKCQSKKNLTVGKYIACRSKAEAKLVTSGDVTAYNETIAKCTAKFDGKWPKLEQTAVNNEALCPSVGDLSSIRNFTDACGDAVVGALGGGTLPVDVATCNSTLGSCIGDLATCDSDYATCSSSLPTCLTDSATCTASLATCSAGTATAADVRVGKSFSSSAGLGLTGTAYEAPPRRTGQTICYFLNAGSSSPGPCAGSGQDGDFRKGVARAYSDNGDGTVTDTNNGLVWEKHDDNNANGIHDVDRTFTWNNAFKKIQVLNGNAVGCIAANDPDSCCAGAGAGSCTAFAGHNDWRLPNIFELLTLLDFELANDPSVDPAFHHDCAAGCVLAACSCNGAHVSGSGGLDDSYLSSTSYPSAPAEALQVLFDGTVIHTAKSAATRVRAVRGGS